MALLAPAAVRNAWLSLVAAERSFDNWSIYVFSGDPDEQPPAPLMVDLDVGRSRSPARTLLRRRDHAAPGQEGEL